MTRTLMAFSIVAAGVVGATSTAWATASRAFVGNSGTPGSWDTTSGVSVRAHNDRADRLVTDMINGEGISEDGTMHTSTLHIPGTSNTDGTMWLGPSNLHDPGSSALSGNPSTERFTGVETGPWVEFSFTGGAVALDAMHVWNYGEGGYPHWSSMSMQNVQILHTTVDGADGFGSDTEGDWTELDNGTFGFVTLSPNDNDDADGNFTATDVISFGGVQAKHVLLRALGPEHASTWNYVDEGGGTNYDLGLSEVRFVAVPEPATLGLLGIGGLALFLRRRTK